MKNILFFVVLIGSARVLDLWADPDPILFSVAPGGEVPLIFTRHYVRERSFRTGDLWELGAAVPEEAELCREAGWLNTVLQRLSPRVMPLFEFGEPKNMSFPIDDPSKTRRSPLRIYTGSLGGENDSLMSVGAIRFSVDARKGYTSRTNDGLKTGESLTKHLDVLDLFGCRMTEDQLPYLSRFESLEALALPFLGVNGFSDEFKLPPNLKTLVVYNTEMTSHVCSAISKLEDLQHLVLWGCCWEGVGIDYPLPLSQLESLVLFNCDFMQELTAEPFPKLRKLEVSTSAPPIFEVLATPEMPVLEEVTVHLFVDPGGFGLDEANPEIRRPVERFRRELKRVKRSPEIGPLRVEIRVRRMTDINSVVTRRR